MVKCALTNILFVLVTLYLSCYNSDVARNSTTSGTKKSQKSTNTSMFNSPKITGSKIKITGVSTTFSKSWDSWKIKLSNDSGRLTTTFSKSWDSWKLSLGRISENIKSTFSKSWDRWKCGNIRIETVFSNSFDRWKVTGDGKTLKVSTVFSKSWDRWKIQGPNGTMSVYTSFSKSWDTWKIEDKMPDEDLKLKSAAVFACIVSAIKSNVIKK